MELRALRYFVAVVEAGSLSAAAAQLHLSQPSLSVAIGKLETELGVQLLVRSPRGVQVTSAGKYLLDASSRVLGDIDEIARELRRYGSGTVGSVTIAAVPVMMWHRLPRVLRAFVAAVPEVDVKLVDPPPWTALDLLQQRRADAAVIMVAEPDRFVARHRDQFAIFDWGEIPLVAVLPRDDIAGEVSSLGALGDREPLSIDEFAGRHIVLPQRMAAVSSLPETVDAALRRSGVVPAHVSTSATIQTCIPLIEAGLASSILPDPDRRSLARFNVATRPLTPEPDPLRALVLTRHEASNDAVIARFLQCL